MTTTCGARTRDGHPCLNPPMRDATRCRMHGGATLNSRAAAERRAIERTAKVAAQKLGIHVTTNSAAALIDELARTSSAINYWQQLAETRLTATGYPTDDDGRPDPAIALWQSEREHLRRVADTMQRHQLDERLGQEARELAEFCARMFRDYVNLIGPNTPEGIRADQYFTERIQTAIKNPQDREELGIATPCTTP